MSKISSLTVINQQGTKQFFINCTYNGLLLHVIKDESDYDGESFYTAIYRGYTKAGELVFETVNAPIEVSYASDDLDLTKI